MGKSSDIHGTWKQRLAGKLVALMIRVLGLTLRVRVNDPHGCKQKALSGEAMIWALWHNCLFTGPLALPRMTGGAPTSALASASKDGAVVASVLASFGVRTIRGSSSRRGASALVAMRKALRGGEQVMLTPDGPRGPVGELQPGVVKLAQVAACAIVPMRFTHSSSWRLKSWDKFHIPVPFSSVTVDLEEPITVPGDLDEIGFESCRKSVEDALGSAAE